MPALGARRPMSSSTSSAWPLPSTPAMPTTSPWCRSKDTSSSSGGRPPAPSRETSLDAAARTSSVTVDSRVSGVGSSLPTISWARSRGVTSAGLTSATVVPARTTVIGVGDLEHLVELVRDEQYGQALCAQLGEVGEQLVDLLRYEHSRGLVEDQDAGAAVEDLEDLDPLSVADAEVLDHPVGLHAQPVRVGDLEDAPAGGGPVEPTAERRRLAAEDDVLEDGEVVGEHEVLVHHADAGVDRVGGGAERHFLAVDPDHALVGALHPVQDLHQRRLAGAVLADDRVHLAAGRPAG